MSDFVYGDLVWISNVSEEEAIEEKRKFMFICRKPGKFPFVVQDLKSAREDDNGGLVFVKYITPVRSPQPKKKIVEMMGFEDKIYVAITKGGFIKTEEGEFLPLYLVTKEDK